MAVKRIISPLDPGVTKTLCVGDMVSLSGRIVTGRDQVHKYLAEGGRPPIDLRGLVIYHCGPIMVEENGRWKITAAGPTTSMREEPYEAEIISRLRPGAIMGKGGMGEKTRKALRDCVCVYLHAIGGAAQYLAQRITKVEAVYLTDFGQPEAMWVLDVKDLPAMVTMDSSGKSLHSYIKEESLKNLSAVYEHPFLRKGQN
jgi:tartrate/fumarate subfamily iron-sulfur-dependent hydro-lyase beta chain